MSAFKGAVVASAVLLAALYHNELHNALYEAYPDVDRRIIRRALRRGAVAAWLGEYETTNTVEGELKSRFLRQVAAATGEH